MNDRLAPIRSLCSPNEQHRDIACHLDDELEHIDELQARQEEAKHPSFLEKVRRSGGRHPRARVADLQAEAGYRYEERRCPIHLTTTLTLQTRQNLALHPPAAASGRRPPRSSFRPSLRSSSSSRWPLPPSLPPPSPPCHQTP